MKDPIRSQAVAIALAFALAPVYAQQPQSPPLKNWAAPLYWAPQPGEIESERAVQRNASSLATQQASIFTAPGPLTFIAITPCRVMDTRSSQPFTGAFGPPSLAAYVTRQVPMPSSTTCSIPSNAGAYSLNITVVPPGVMSFLSVWPAGQAYPGVSTINDPISGGVLANAAIVVAGTAGAIQMVAGNITDVIIDINGYYAAPTDGSGNTAIGAGTLASNTTGSANTATGLAALQSNTTGSADTATGLGALQSNTTGDNNTASGYMALNANTSGFNNTASGSGALASNAAGSSNTANGNYALNANTTGNANTAVGGGALSLNTTGNANTALGQNALNANTTGNGNVAIGGSALQDNVGTQNTAIGNDALGNSTGAFNSIAVGWQAAVNVTGGSSNIHIGNAGSSGDSNVIKIGTESTQNSTFIAGISGATSSGGVEVLINSSGQLGTMTSSRRFKEQITGMGDTSNKLFQLRPVNFFYKPEYDDGSHLLQYGLIAEEVANVYPEMVAYDSDGQILTVRYQMLAPMLLNEVQKQNAQIQSQAEVNRLQQEQNRQQAGQIRSLEERLAALETLLSGQTSTRPAGSQ